MLKKKIIKWFTAPIATIQTVLIVFRLIGQIDWSWWLVFLPLILVGALGLLVWIFKSIWRKKYEKIT